MNPSNKSRRKKSLVGWTYGKPYLHWDSENVMFCKYAVMSPIFKIKGNQNRIKVRITISEI